MKGNLLFVTGCYPKEYEKFYINQSKVMPQNAANELSWRIIEGLDENIPSKFNVLTTPFIGYYPRGFKRLIIRSRSWSHNGVSKDTLLGFINIKGLETYIKSERIYKFIKKWCRENKQNRHVLIYSHYAGFLRAVGKIKKKVPDLHVTCLITDMPELNERKDLQGFVGKIKGLPRQIMINTTYKNLGYVDSFVLLTEKMKEYLSIGEKPYIVIEGMAPYSSEKEMDPINDGIFKIVYTGTLHRKYGICNLLDAMDYLKNENVALYVCGDGDCREEVIKRAKEEKNINYLGVLKHCEAIALQQSASLLINPRPDFGLQTALSFPSKTMEYMLVGKPVYCFKLKGIPNDYDKYLMYFSDEDPKNMAKDIRALMNLSKEELGEIGKRNYNFVRNYKNPKVQTRKILDMLEKE